MTRLNKRNREMLFNQPIQVTSECQIVPHSATHSQILFCTGSTTPVNINSGISTSVLIPSSGNYGGDFTLTGSSTFTPTAGNAYSFIMPYDATITEIYMNAKNNTAWIPECTMYPYVALATAPPESNTFTIIPSTQTAVSTPYVDDGKYVGIDTVYNGKTTGLSIPIVAGTRVAIVCGRFAPDGGTALSGRFYFSGGILLN